MPTENRTGGKIVPYGTSHITVKVWHISYEVLFFLRNMVGITLWIMLTLHSPPPL